MKLKPRTIQILKNYSSINPSMLFKKGHHQVTMHPMKKMLVRAAIEEEIPADFAIFDLSKFIGTLSLFNDPELTVGKKYITIAEGGQKVNFTFGDPDVIIGPSAQTMKMPSNEIQFKLTDVALAQLMKASSILDVPHVIFRGNSEVVEVGAGKCDDPSGNKFMVEVGLTTHEFQFVVGVDTFRVLPGTYDATITKDGIIHLQTTDIEYWISTEANFRSFS